MKKPKGIELGRLPIKEGHAIRQFSPSLIFLPFCAICKESFTDDWKESVEEAVAELNSHLKEFHTVTV